jgi:hypothetical protein
MDDNGFDLEILLSVEQDGKGTVVTVIYDHECFTGTLDECQVWLANKGIRI